MAERLSARFSVSEVLEMVDQGSDIHSDSENEMDELEVDCEEPCFPGSDEEFGYVEEEE